jgi:hypothetical protein
MISGADEATATEDGWTTTVSDRLAGAISGGGVSSANSRVSPVSIERGVREPPRERESESSGVRRTESGGRGSEGVLMSGS